MIFLLYRVAYGILPQDPLAPRWLAILFSLSTMGLLWSLTPAFWDPFARLAAPAIFAVLSTTPVGSFGFPANTEIFLCGFAALSVWALELRRRTEDIRWLFLCGLAAGAGLMTKQTAAWAVLAFGVMIVWREGFSAWKRPLGLFLAGAAAVPASWLIYFSCRGSQGPFLEEVFGRNWGYARVMLQTGTAGSQALWLATIVAPLFLAGDWPVYAAALFALRRGRPERCSVETLATLWLAGALLGAITGLFLFPYYFLPALPPLAVLAASGVQQACQLRPSWRPGIWCLAMFCLYPAWVRRQAYFQDRPQMLARRLLYPNPLFESVAIADHIRGQSRPEDTLYIFGSEAQIYIYAGRHPATEHVLSYPLTLFPRDRRDIERELSRISAAHPRFIVYSNQPASALLASALGVEFRDRLRDQIRREYAWAGEVRISPAGTSVHWGPSGEGRVGPDWSDESCLWLFERRR
jgi:4-amino-4-deoxy-L-arabinose transferase-like glycosyltransferase